MEFDGRIEKLRDIVKPLTVSVRLVKRLDVYYLHFAIKNPAVLEPSWQSLHSFIKPLMKMYFPNAVMTSGGILKLNYRLGSLFEFLCQKND
jgi:hypothetical protein